LDLNFGLDRDTFIILLRKSKQTATAWVVSPKQTLLPSFLPHRTLTAQLPQPERMVAVFAPGQSFEMACKASTSTIADHALACDFNQFAEHLEAYLYAQLFVCSCRLMTDTLVSVLLTPPCDRDSYVADQFADVRDLLWNFVRVPPLAATHKNDADNFVKLFIISEYENSAEQIVFAFFAEFKIGEPINCLTSKLTFTKSQNGSGCDVNNSFRSVSTL
jgi:hypothetical protein